jgi:hypothetical protein
MAQRHDTLRANFDVDYVIIYRFTDTSKPPKLVIDLLC